MKIVTKDFRNIECKFISYGDDGKATITLWDGEIVKEEITNIDYITIS